jgi:hypothetical protein
MTTVLVLLMVAGAAYAAAGPKILAEIRKAFGLIPKVEGRHVAGAALLAAAALVWSNMPAKAPPPAPSPAPAPATDSRIASARNSAVICRRRAPTACCPGSNT